MRDIGALVGVKHLDSLHMQVPFQVLTLDACVDVARSLLWLTTWAQSVSMDVAGVGGPTDIVTITADAGVQVVQRKSVNQPDAVPTTATRMPMPTAYPLPVLRVETSADPRRASSYTARIA